MTVARSESARTTINQPANQRTHTKMPPQPPHQSAQKYLSTLMAEVIASLAISLDRLMPGGVHAYTICGRCVRTCKCSPFVFYVCVCVTAVCHPSIGRARVRASLSSHRCADRHEKQSDAHKTCRYTHTQTHTHTRARTHCAVPTSFAIKCRCVGQITRIM